MTTKALATEIWDLYKDAYGVRPRHLDSVQWTDREFLIRLWHQCRAVILIQRL
jgi:hypothetical protein